MCLAITCDWTLCLFHNARMKIFEYIRIFIEWLSLEFSEAEFQKGNHADYVTVKISGTQTFGTIFVVPRGYLLEKRSIAVSFWGWLSLAGYSLKEGPRPHHPGKAQHGEDHSAASLAHCHPDGWPGWNSWLPTLTYTTQDTANIWGASQQRRDCVCVSVLVFFSLSLPFK